MPQELIVTTGLSQTSAVAPRPREEGSAPASLGCWCRWDRFSEPEPRVLPLSSLTEGSQTFSKANERGKAGVGIMRMLAFG